MGGFGKGKGPKPIPREIPSFILEERNFFMITPSPRNEEDIIDDDADEDEEVEVEDIEDPPEPPEESETILPPEDDDEEDTDALKGSENDPDDWGDDLDEVDDLWEYEEDDTFN
jgi:hypothetical protein